MAQEDLLTGLDILHAVLRDCGQTAAATDEYGAEAKRYIREAYWDVLGRHRWPWALSPTPGILTTTASQSVTVSSISSATPAVVTLSAAIATSQAGMKFFMNGNQSIYRVASHTAGTALLTLDAQYVETETGGAATLYQDEYQLTSSVLKVWDPLTVRGSWWQTVRLLDKPMFERQYGRAWAAGPAPIEAACEINPSAYSASISGTIKRIRVAPWSMDAVNLEYDYAAYHTLDFTGAGEGDTPKIPREFRGVLVSLATYALMILKDENKADQAIVRAEQTIAKMVERFIPAQMSGFAVAAKHSATLGCT